MAVGDIATALVNPKYEIEEAGFLRKFSVTLDYTVINNVNVPSGTQVNLEVQIANSNQQVTKTLTVLKTVQNAGQFNLIFTDNLSVFPDDVAFVAIGITERTSSTLLSGIVSISATLSAITCPVPSGNEVTIGFNNGIILKDNIISGSLAIVKTSNFPTSCNNEPLVVNIRLNDSNGVTFAVEQEPFVFQTANHQFNFVLDAQGNTEIEIHAFVTNTDLQSYGAFATKTFFDQTSTPTNKDVTVIAENEERLFGIVFKSVLVNLQSVLPTLGASISGVDTQEPKNLDQQTVIDFANANREVTPPENFDVTIRAEDNAELGGTLTALDKDVVIAGVGAFNAIIVSSVSTTSPVSSSAIILLGFAKAHQVTTSPTNKDIIVFAQDDATMNFIVSVADFDALVNSLPEFQATISDVDTTQTINSDFVTVLAFARDHQTITDDSVIAGMVTTKPINMQIKQGSDRITGSIEYVATDSFNPFWFSTEKNILSFIQMTFPDGQQFIKENLLSFTETERDEIIIINESAQGQKSVIIDFFVWANDGTERTFAFKRQKTIIEGAKPEVENGRVIEIIKGVFFGSLALALLTSKGR